MRRVAITTVKLFGALSTLTAFSVHTATPVSSVAFNQMHFCATRPGVDSAKKTSARTNTALQEDPVAELKQAFGDESWKTFEEKMPEWKQDLRLAGFSDINPTLVACGISPLKTLAMATALVVYFEKEKQDPLAILKQTLGDKLWKVFEEKMPKWAEQLKDYSADTIFSVLRDVGIKDSKAIEMANTLAEYLKVQQAHAPWPIHSRVGSATRIFTVKDVLEFLKTKGVVRNPTAPKCLASRGSVPPEEHGTVNGVPLDPRRAACDTFIDTFEEALKTLTIQQWNYDSRRLPLVANVGFTGTGKTTLKQLCMERFVKTYPDSRAIYVMFNGDQRHHRERDTAHVDGSAEVGIRILHRVAQHLKNEDLDFHSFRKELRSYVPFEVAVEAARELLGMGPTAHLLIAVDQLVRLNEGDDNAVTAAQTLATLCWCVTDSFHKAKSWKGPAESRPGVTYLVASASRAVDALSLTSLSDRPVFLQELDPLYYSQRMADALHGHFNKSGECEKNFVLVPGSVGWPSTLPGTSTSDMEKVRAIIMKTLWCTGFHPRLLGCVLREFEHQPTGEQGPQLVEAMKEWSENALNYAAHKACVSFESRVQGPCSTRKERMYLLRRLFGSGPYPKAKYGSADRQLLHLAQTQGLVNIREARGDDCTVLMPQPVLVAMARKNNLPSKDGFVVEMRRLCELFHVEKFSSASSGKYFEQLVCCTLLAALQSKNIKTLSALFETSRFGVTEVVKAKTGSLLRDVISAASHTIEEIGTDGTECVFPFKKTGLTTRRATVELKNCACYIRPNSLHDQNAVDFVIRVEMSSGRFVDLYVQAKEWFKDDLSVGKDGTKNIVEDFRKHRKQLADFHRRSVGRGGDDKTHGAIHVLASVNPEEQRSWKAHPTEEEGIGEAFLDMTTLMSVCPSVAGTASTAAVFRSMCKFGEPSEPVNPELPRV